ncbi:hypothetical protein JMM61_11985 [Rhodovulum sulfidophilum]|uniref:hypothetical protein n=1 Tax=Rhodovulum sulfidophilum TaxID=35806 RepID=UPI001927CE1E|nr:hypothetical protein [Rhodovulum sulfidophilum]MBL3586097.1 hypothetical protein [Rhodovulum sulfidophilum]
MIRATALGSLLVGLTVAGGIALALGHGLVSERRAAVSAPTPAVPAANPVAGARIASSAPADPTLPVFRRRTVRAIPAGATEAARPDPALPVPSAPRGSALLPQRDGPRLVSIEAPRPGPGHGPRIGVRVAPRFDAAADMAPPPRPPFRQDVAAGAGLPEQVDSENYLIGVYR